MAVKIINSNSSIVLSLYRILQRYYFGNKSNNPLYKEYINLNALLINKDYANNRRVNNNQSNHHRANYYISIYNVLFLLYGFLTFPDGAYLQLFPLWQA